MNAVSQINPETIRTVKAASDLLRLYGMTIRSVEGEYRVSFTVDRILSRGLCASFSRARTIAEELACYETDLPAAIGTAMDMHKRLMSA